jgi:hypothetical protein
MQKSFIVVLLALIALFSSSPAYSQEKITLADVFSGKKYPTVIRLKEITGEGWSRFDLRNEQSKPELSSNYILQSQRIPLGYYLTKGETFFFEGITFLVAYHANTASITEVINKLQVRDSYVDPDLFVDPEPESEFELALINLQQTLSITQIRPFTPITPKIKAPTPVTEVSLKRLKTLGLAVLMYTQDYDDVLPPMKEVKKFQEVVTPYVRGATMPADYFVNPVTSKPYVLNLILSQHKLATLPQVASFVLAYEDQPAPDGTRGVVFVDGHAARIQETEWTRLKKISKIP